MQGGSFFLKYNKTPLYPDHNSTVSKLIRENATPLTGKNDFRNILTAIGNSKVVLIGEASHGTHEFYKIRADITKKLIEEKNFSFIGVEGDWPDVYRINRYVCGKSEDTSAKAALGDFSRFPRWMWRNTVVEEFVEWLRQYNKRFSKLDDMVRFCGLDMYSMYRSADEVIKYLDQVDPNDAKVARARYGTLGQYRNNEYQYAMELRMRITPPREREVVEILKKMLDKGDQYLRGYGGFIDGDELFYNQTNARVVKSAEEYYRKAYAGGAVTWNIRDKHMFDTLQNILLYQQEKRGNSKGVVWAHNSHIGDSRATEYARESGEWNIGQLVREKIGKENSFNIGFTSYTGTVTAAPGWGEPSQTFELTPAFDDSYEALFHRANPSDWSVILRSNDKSIVPDSKLIKELELVRTERMVGVQYVKKTERQSHYVPSDLPHQFDAVIHIDQTNALKPLDPPTQQSD
eukprot:TRINITY_DN3556_c0_g1_i1.p1 TRINITY_DN3556_c0_g1~~TRINITY_DN3556_c0_g1_i1.p1  ORF type:complete len:475 (+),score=120.62 TRINITY_DN3556_c0_g1_i1:43-1425(+)